MGRTMKLLFIHQNYPAQFKNLAPALASAGHEVVALSLREHPVPVLGGVRLVRYQPQRGTTPGVHPWVGDFETKAIRGEAAFRAMLRLRESGFVPDVVVAHPGWGESLFVRHVWPRARLGIYCEYFYRPDGADVGFDPEFANHDPADPCRVQLKNVNNLLHFEIAQAGLSPTHFQADTFPQPFRQRITVVHDGVDTAQVAPEPGVRLRLGPSLTLSRDDEVVTFVNRNLEPYRGYHVFMRALPALLRARPSAHVLIVGGDSVSYGARAPAGRSWKQVFVEEVRPRIPDAHWARVHFLGNLPYGQFVPLLQLSTAHVYLSYPFVLSWSLLEAMSAGCAIVASDTVPVREAITHELTGRLVPCLDPDAVATALVDLLGDAGARRRLGENARALARDRYDLRRVCLPRQLQWVSSLAG
jgi:glycosyltransferase involved in cell wall biosynthesis